jgi:CheY-like chemotaxis protein
MNSELVVVDDDKVFLIILRKMIQIVDPSARLTIFGSGSEALAYFRANPDRERSHLMLDINLTDMDAWDLMDNLQELPSPCPRIVLMTSSVSASNLEKSKKYFQVVGLFEKPITLEILRQIFELINKD